MSMSHWKKVLMGMVCAAALAGIASDGEAQTVAGMAGHGWPNHFDGCFGSSWSRMVNNCGGSVGSQRLLIVPTQAYWYGWGHHPFPPAARTGGGRSTHRHTLGT